MDVWFGAAGQKRTSWTWKYEMHACYVCCVAQNSFVIWPIVWNKRLKGLHTQHKTIYLWKCSWAYQQSLTKELHHHPVGIFCSSKDMRIWQSFWDESRNVALHTTPKPSRPLFCGIQKTTTRKLKGINQNLHACSFCSKTERNLFALAHLIVVAYKTGKLS